MTADWSREQTVRLIRSFKKQEILWNSRSKSYRDRRRKAIAWEAVVNEVGIPVEICKRRVESLLASCRREKNKIMKSKEIDEPKLVYEPKWVFWKEFRFLRGSPDCEDDQLDANLDGVLSTTPQWSPSARRPPRKRRKAGEPLKIEENWQSKKPQREGDEHDAFGITVAAKLRKMEENQRLFAENIINQALYKGLLFQLSIQSEAEFMHQRMQQQPEPQPNTQWTQQHNFAPPNTSYSNKTTSLSSHTSHVTHPSVHPSPLLSSSHQPRQESAEDFKQINML